MAFVQPQYATLTELQALSITPAAYARFAAQQNGTQCMTNALQAASSLVDGYIDSQFTLPLITWGMDLKRCVCNIAAFELYNDYGFSPNAAPGDDMVLKRYERAMAWLKGISDEEITPQFVDSSSVYPEAGPYSVSDQIVGFTERGRNDTGVVAGPAGPVFPGNLTNGGW